MSDGSYSIESLRDFGFSVGFKFAVYAYFTSLYAILTKSNAIVRDICDIHAHNFDFFTTVKRMFNGRTTKKMQINRAIRKRFAYNYNVPIWGQIGLL